MMVLTWTRAAAPDEFVVIRDGGRKRPILAEVLRLVWATICGEARGFVCRLLPSTCPHKIVGRV